LFDFSQFIPAALLFVKSAEHIAPSRFQAKEPIMATEKQFAANRRNSQKSSGPRNTTRSRYNALQHGLCAEHFEIPEDVPSTVSIQEHLDHWNNFYQPASPVEALLVREIVTCQWRLERAPRQETGLLAKVIDECFYDAWYKDKETGKKVYYCAYDWEEDLQDAQEKSARLLGMAWRQMCRNGDPLPKLQRYETALSNRIHKAVKLLLKLRGHDRPGELPNAELRNEPNFEQVAEEPVACPVENTVKNPPPPPPEPKPDHAAPPENGTPLTPTKPPARETTPTPVKLEPETAPKAPPKRL
jgi:hypothetical protein